MTHDPSFEALPPSEEGGSSFEPFRCTQCGLCCRRVPPIPQFAELDRGDGVCRELDLETNRCRIYETRPLLCRTAASYEAIFQGQMTREAFYKLNEEACEAMQREAGWVPPEAEPPK